MYTKTTNGISIRVLPHFEPTHSRLDSSLFVFSYHIELINNSDDVVQLMRRHWTIKHGDGFIEEVEGPGVVGEQPILYPGQKFEYSSWCQMHAPIGEMFGEFTMYSPAENAFFDADVPNFKLIFPAILN